MDDLCGLRPRCSTCLAMDVQLTDIEYLPRSHERVPQRFAYATRIGFGVTIRGGGEAVGGRDEVEGGRTSALKFSSNNPKSLIREGAY